MSSGFYQFELYVPLAADRDFFVCLLDHGDKYQLFEFRAREFQTNTGIIRMWTITSKVG
jgi:hypothetical protein